jgi:hypothetical protein
MYFRFFQSDIVYFVNSMHPFVFFILAQQEMSPGGSVRMVAYITG